MKLGATITSERKQGHKALKITGNEYISVRVEDVNMNRIALLIVTEDEIVLMTDGKNQTIKRNLVGNNKSERSEHENLKHGKCEMKDCQNERCSPYAWCRYHGEMLSGNL